MNRKNDFPNTFFTIILGGAAMVIFALFMVYLFFAALMSYSDACIYGFLSVLAYICVYGILWSACRVNAEKWRKIRKMLILVLAMLVVILVVWYVFEEVM